MHVSHESIYRTLVRAVARCAAQGADRSTCGPGGCCDGPGGPDSRWSRESSEHRCTSRAAGRSRATGRCPVIGKVIWSSARGMSPVATLVERSTRYLMLVALPDGNHKADAVADALAAAVAHLPEQLAKSLTWDHGHEMAEHARFSAETGMTVYFCDPKSALAARQQREHQRTAAPVPAPPTRLPDAHPSRLRRHRRRAQRPPSTNPRLQDTIRSTSRSVALTA